MTADPIIDGIRRVRHEISAACGHDPKQLVAYYRELQKRCPSRVVNFGAAETVILRSVAASEAGGTQSNAAR